MCKTGCRKSIRRNFNFFRTGFDIKFGIVRQPSANSFCEVDTYEGQKHIRFGTYVISYHFITAIDSKML